MKVSNVFLLCAWVLSSAVNAQPAQEASRAVSEGVSGIGQGSATVLGGSVNVLKGSGALVIAGVEASGEAVVVTFRSVGQGVSEAGEFSVKLARDAVGGASLAVGQSVQYVSLATGVAISFGGQVLAFLPNEIGRQLLHRERLG